MNPARSGARPLRRPQHLPDRTPDAESPTSLTPDGVARLARPRRGDAAGPGPRCADPGGHRPVRPGGQQDLLREQLAGHSARGVGRPLRRRVRHAPGLLDRDLGQRRTARRLQDRHQRQRVHDRHLPHGLLQRRRRAEGRRASRRPWHCRSTSRTASATSRPSSTTAATGPSPRHGTSRPRPSPASTSRACTAPDLDESSHITFIVRDDASHSELVFQTADTTWQAYNTYGGSNFY